MSQENVTRYVKLVKEQATPVEDITPGELNQPIQVPQLNVHRCHECGQPLPESYEPPADEDWTTDICNCAEDPESCRAGFLCPCVLFGHNIEAMGEDIPGTTACVSHAVCVEGGLAVAAATALLHGIIAPDTSCLICQGLVFSWWICGIYTGLFRQSLQKKYHLKDSPCDPCLVHCFMHWCALCQEHREMKSRLSDNAATQMTIVNPPPIQEMNSGESHEPASLAPAGTSSTSVAPSAQSSETGKLAKLEIQPA